MNTVFGPVPSRRLGRSLGIDVVPSKTCSYDCIYCESGRTTHLTCKRRAFVDPDRVVQELEQYFSTHPQGADVLTFSSAGEPTLYAPLGELIRVIRKRFTSMPLIVLTNGSLLWDPEVRRALMEADRVVPSLDAVTQQVFEDLNRPHPALDLSAIMEGLLAFRREYKGQLHIEVMLASGYNDHPDQLREIRRMVDRLDPHQLELNTVVRPPAVAHVRGLSAEEMKRAQSFFPEGRTCIIGKFQASGNRGGELDLDQRILDLVRRRPCTVIEMAASLGVSLGELNETLAKLQTENRLTRYRFNGEEYLRMPR